MTAQQRLRILLVEDDNHIGRIIELALPELGVPYEFVTALSAEEGLELWDQQPFDLLLTDYNLRGMTGLKLVELLRQRGAQAPIVLVTAYDSDALRKESRALDIDAYLTKPFFMDDLVETVRGLLPQISAREVNGP
ncbi:MAG TPA: response regulator [Chloroflexaceae bacterium]|nr:response regulator [Chloroflexaceae bacterium]